MISNESENADQSGEAPVGELPGVLLCLPETACALRTRPPEWFGLAALGGEGAIIFADFSMGDCRHFDCAI